MTEQKKPVVEWLKSLAGEVKGDNAVNAICQLAKSTQVEVRTLPFGYDLANALLAIADEVKAEQNAIVEAQGEHHNGIGPSAHHIMKTYAESKSKPMEEGETITEWLGRWYVPRPVFEDGEPVQWGDGKEIAWNASGHWSFNGINEEGTALALGFDEICAQAQMCNGRVVHKASPALDADGVEIKVGDTVWFVSGAKGVDCFTPWTVIEVQGAGSVAIGCGVKDHEGSYERERWNEAPDLLTHREPDSLEKLRDDMRFFDTECDIESALDSWTARLTTLIERGQ